MNLFGRLNHFGAIIGAPKLAQNPELMLPHEFTDGTSGILSEPLLACVLLLVEETIEYCSTRCLVMTMLMDSEFHYS